jgi:DNA ligase (NAD+)
MDIEGLGDKLIARFLDEGLLTDIASIYRLERHRETLVGKDRLGDLSIQNLLDAIETSKNRSLDRLIFGLGIPQVGARGARDLAKAFGTMAKLRRAGYADFLAVPDVGPRTASELESWFEDAENSATLDALQELGVRPVETAPPEGDLFTGKTFVFTGKLEEFTREAAEAVVEKLGGAAAGSVSKATSYVVAGPGAGSKLAKAESLNIPVISEAEFLALLPPGTL